MVIRLGPAEKPKMYRDAERRFHKMDPNSILDWADQSGSWSARQLMEYRRQRRVEYLQEAKDGVLVALAAIDELIAREEEH